MFQSLRRGRIPTVIQTQMSECGLACLAMVSSYHGANYSLNELRQRYGASQRGVKIQRLVEVANDLGLGTRILRVELSDLPRLAMPCILHWDMSHFVVLAATDGKRFNIFDPAKGRRSLSLEAVAKSFTGVALELGKTGVFEARPERPGMSIRGLIGPVSGLARALVTVLLLSIAVQSFTVLSPLLLQTVVDQAVPAGDSGLLLVICLAFSGLVVLLSFAGFLRGWVVSRIASDFGPQWQSKVFEHLIRLPVPYFETRHIGDIVSRLGSTATIQKTITTTLVDIVMDVILVVSIVAISLYYSPGLIAISLAAILLYGCLKFFTMPLLRDLSEEQLDTTARLGTMTMEAIRGILSVRLAGGEPLFSAIRRQGSHDAALSEFRVATLRQFLASSSVLVFGLERIAVVGVGALLVLDGKFTIGMLVAFLAYREMLSARASSLIDKWSEMRLLRLHADRLSDIALCEREDVGVPRSLSYQGDSLRLEVRSVSFRYGPDLPWVLKDCSFSVEFGESVAIVGPSGGGKTTLVKILLGLLKPTTGEVLIGGTRLETFGLGNFRRLCGTVMQDDCLFARSISENISFGAENADDEEIELAAKAACIHEDIGRMPMGYRTKLGELGTSVSGGQKQRIILARAIYRRPKLFFLDEATSHLDIQNESKVSSEISKLQATRIIVAHRTETIATASRVLQLSGGVLREDIRSKSSSPTAEPPAHIDVA